MVLGMAGEMCSGVTSGLCISQDPGDISRGKRSRPMIPSSQFEATEAEHLLSKDDCMYWLLRDGGTFETC